MLSVLHTVFKVAILLLVISTSMSDKRLRRKPKLRKMRAHEQDHSYILKDMPMRSDFNTYMTSLNKIVHFCRKNKDEIDMNFAFGLFLTKVNLESALRHTSRNLPDRLKESMRDVLETTDELLQFFNSMVRKEEGPDSLIYKQIQTLFTNSEEWTNHIDKYNVRLDTKIYQKTPEQLKAIYGKWDVYSSKIYDISDFPDHKESDVCIASIATSPVSIRDGSRICKMDYFCNNMLQHGTDLGYPLTHRVFLLLLARIARGCSLISPAADRKMALRFCSSAYAEAEYIAQHELQEMDLVLEQVAFCTLNGHKEFLRHSWLSRLLWRQRGSGCFGQLKPGSDWTDLTNRRRWKIDKLTYEENIMRDSCESHLTATAAATIASVIRYILETYFSDKR